MSELEHIEKVFAVWPRRESADGDAAVPLRLVEEALLQHPASAKLHCMKGDLIQLSDGLSYQLEDALASYERAVEVAPDFSEAHEAIGYYHDLHTHDFERAERAFRLALKHGAGVNSYVGLAEVLRERNVSLPEILLFLDSSPYATDEKVRHTRSEIEDWHSK